MSRSQQVKLLLDECLGSPLVKSIREVLSWDDPSPQIQHLLEFFESGTKDQVWIPKVKDEGWIILTADRGKKGKHKLPQICAHYKITHIIMCSSVLRLKQYQKANAIISVWEQIKECNNAPRGTRFRFRLNTAHRPIIELAVPS